MSISTVSTIMDRIAVARPRSPIAVFRPKPGYYDAMFAHTVTTQKRIELAHDHTFIGCYDNTMDLAKVRKELNSRWG